MKKGMKMATKILPKIERRNAILTGVTMEDNSGTMKLCGHASVFNQPTVICEIGGIEYKEEIDKDAFNEADISECCLKYNHSDHIPILSRVKGGKLKLTTDSVGLRFDADLFNTSTAKDIYNIVQEGGLDSCSFAFTVKEESYNEETHIRKILKINKLFDISVVDFPAYSGTDVSARSFFEAEAEKKKALENAETERKRTILKNKLMNV